MTERQQIEFLHNFFYPQKRDLKKTGKYFEIVFNGKEIEKIRSFRDKTNLPHNGQSISQIDAVHQNLSIVGKKPTCQHFQKSRFTRPVVPDDGNQFPFFYLKIDW